MDRIDGGIHISCKQMLYSLVSFFYWLFFVRNKQIFHPVLILSLLNMLYFGLGSFLFNQIWDLDKVNELNLSAHIFTVNIAIIVGHILSKKTKPFRLKLKIDNVLLYSLMFSFIVSVLALIVIGGGSEFFSKTRAQRFEIFNDNTLLIFVESAGYLAHTIYVFKKKKASLWTVLFLLWAVLNASRNSLLLTLAPFIYIYISKVNIYKGLFLGLLAGILLFISKSVISGGLGISENTEIVQIGELVNWKRNYYTLNNSKFEQSMPNPLILNLKGLVAPSVRADNRLSDWFMLNYYPEFYSKGNKYGFDPFSEHKVLLGNVSLFIYWVVIVLVLCKIDRSQGEVYNAIFLLSLLSAYKLFRSESYNYVRYVSWYLAYIIFVINAFGNFVRFHKTIK